MLKPMVRETTFFDDFIFQHYIPPDHKLVKIKSFVNLDFIPELVKGSYAEGSAAGRTPIDPKILFRVCLLAFLENLSDVEASKKLFEVPVYRYFVGLGPDDAVPDDTTISYFRVKRMGEKKFKQAFQEMVRQLYAAGLIDGKIQSQDATHMQGNSEILDTFGLLGRCRENLLRATKRLDPALYEEWTKQHGGEVTWQGKDRQKQFEALIAACRSLHQAALKQRRLLKDKRFHREVTLLHRVIAERQDEWFNESGKKEQKEHEKKIVGKMINPSDPDMNWGAKSDKKFFAGYKVETNLDHRYGMITAVEGERAGHPEEKKAATLLQEQQSVLGILPEHFTADAKYDYGNTRVEIQSLGWPDHPIQVYIPLVAAKHKGGGFLLDDFQWEGGNLTCPAGYPAESQQADDKKLGFEFRFNPRVCGACHLKKDCTTAKFSGRRVFLSSSQVERKAVVSFNASKAYHLVMKGERYKIEPRQADLKNNHGLKRARYRGLSRIRIQVYLAAMASNLKKWFKQTMGWLEEGTHKTLTALAALAPPTGKVCPNTG